MKRWIYVVLFCFSACTGRQDAETNATETERTAAKAETVQPEAASTTTGGNAAAADICWTGTLQGRIPVFIHYQIADNVLVGEITYLNTKEKIPIKLLGTIEQDQTYRLLEFDTTGNITGIITGVPGRSRFNGSWFSPATRKSLTMQLLPKDTLISSADITPAETEIYGKYRYQFGDDGYTGEFDFNKLANRKADFYILALTGVESGGNIAEVDRDTIAVTGNSFTYTIPNSDACRFKVNFYKGFVYISYTNGTCPGQFGHNASIDGLYLKTE